MGLSGALAREWLAVEMRSHTSLAVDVRVDKLVERDWYSKIDALFESFDHDLLGCMTLRV